ncbi:hypothetical protein [Flavobacterium sp. CF136]|uniref:hypothetical protein n=1 Tax=Flavobacterium sp. (strain CF136) TaxID=1144313 RepID=UPI0002719F12|nr:hypothetical protein [Flavobacterium sp. CF136]EJL66304.1 hypothetical protein PMI10_00652 [Flavobacterium sp. CF136]
MAVEKQKVIARLKVLFPKANLSQQRLDAIADKLAKKPADDADDTAIDAVINDFNDVLSIEEIAKGDDRTRTLEAEKKKSEELAAKKKPSKEEEEEEVIEIDKDIPAWAKAILESNKKLTADLESIKSGNITQSKKEIAQKTFESSEILKGLKPELKDRWVNRIDINSETPIEDQIKELESEYSDLVQVTADSNVYGGPAGGGRGVEKMSADSAKSIVEGILKN